MTIHLKTCPNVCQRWILQGFCWHTRIVTKGNKHQYDATKRKEKGKEVKQPPSQQEISINFVS